MNATKMLYVVVCAAGPALHANRLITSAKGRGWTVHVILTPAASNFRHPNGDLNALTLEHPTPTQRGEPTAIIIAPATFNTINKLANGISDNHVLDVLHPRITHVPTVILPAVNKRYASRMPYIRSLQHLREEGISILDVKPHEAGMGDKEVDKFPWDQGLDVIESLI
jgi:Phosphopantothenoylcysteine synthetase/decarboxylase